MNKLLRREITSKCICFCKTHGFSSTLEITMLFVRITRMLSVHVVCLLLDRDRKTSAQRTSFRPLTQAARVIHKGNLEKKPAGLFLLSARPPGEHSRLWQDAECHPWRSHFPGFVGLGLLQDQASVAGCPAPQAGSPCLHPGCSDRSSPSLPCCWAMQSAFETQHIPLVTPARSYPLMSNSM